MNIEPLEYSPISVVLGHLSGRVGDALVHIYHKKKEKAKVRQVTRIISSSHASRIQLNPVRSRKEEEHVLFIWDVRLRQPQY